MSTDVEVADLTIIVAEAQEDTPCSQRSEECPNEAVIWVVWVGCTHTGHRFYCLPHWRRKWDQGLKGRPTARCLTCNAGPLEASTYGPVLR